MKSQYKAPCSCSLLSCVLTRRVQHAQKRAKTGILWLIIAEMARGEASRTPREHTTDQQTSTPARSHIGLGRARRERPLVCLADAWRSARSERGGQKASNAKRTIVSGTACCAKTTKPAHKVDQAMQDHIPAVAFSLLDVLGELIWASQQRGARAGGEEKGENSAKISATHRLVDDREQRLPDKPYQLTTPV